MTFFRSKKASARDVLVIGVILFALGVGFLIAHYAINTTVDQMLTTPIINESTDAVNAFNNTKSLTNRLDYVLFGIFIALVLFLMITSYFIGGIPIFMFAYFIVIVIAVLLSALLSNTWDDIASSVLSSSVVHFPITSALMTNLPIYMTVIGFVGMVIMFAKPYLSSQ